MTAGGIAHLALEAAAYLVGVRLFLRARARTPNALSGHPRGLTVVVGAVAGAALGSKLLVALQFPQWAFGSLPDLRPLLAGKTLVGGLLGGLLGVEIAKRAIGLRESTGDLFVTPLAVGIVLGRLGCLAAGLGDYTYGNPTRLPWGIDLGDGVPRHPAPLYEIAFVALLALAIHRFGDRLPRSGDRFRLFLAGYLAFRLVADFGKPPHGGFPPALAGQPGAHLYLGVLTAIQLAAVGGLVYYLPDLRRILRGRDRRAVTDR